MYLHTTCVGYAFGGGGSGAARSNGAAVVANGAITACRLGTLPTSSSFAAEKTTLHEANALQQFGCVGTSHGGESFVTLGVPASATGALISMPPCPLAVGVDASCVVASCIIASCIIASCITASGVSTDGVAADIV